jgi:hypothetical protein
MGVTLPPVRLVVSGAKKAPDKVVGWMPGAKCPHSLIEHSLCSMPVIFAITLLTTP